MACGNRGLQDPEDPCHFLLEVLDRSAGGPLLPEESPRPHQKCVEFRNGMHRLGAEIAQFTEIGGRKESVVVAGHRSRCHRDHLPEGMELPCGNLEGDLGLAEELQASGKASAGLGRAAHRRLHLAMEVREPDDHQAVLGKAVSPQQDPAGLFHGLSHGHLRPPSRGSGTPA